jgi:hypothetical protein
LHSVKLWLKSNEGTLIPFLAFTVPLLIRSVPEILMSPFLVGFDTLGYYVPATFLWMRGTTNFWPFMATAPFFYLILMGVTSIGVPIVISLKVMSPLLLGFLGLVIYFYANKTLSWSQKKSLLVVFFATLYFVALRISWDMLRSELGLIFLFIVLIYLKKDLSIFKNGVLLALSMFFVAFAHPLVTIIMFVIILFTIVQSYIDKKMFELRKLIVYSAPSACLFLFIIYANMLSQFPLVNGYLSQGSGDPSGFIGFASYGDLVVDTLGFLVFCYLPLIPLIVLGARRFKGNLQLKAWIFWILLSLLFVIISPNGFFAVYPYRWTLLLTYPLAFYATEAFSGLKLNSYKACSVLMGMGLLFATLSAGFMVLPNSTAFSYYDSFPNYVPKSMLQNTLPLCDCQDTVNVLQWSENNLPINARVLVHNAFFGWASLTLNDSQLICYGFGNPESVARELMSNGSTYNLYLIWWINGSGWYGQPTVSSSFKQVYQSGRIAVFTYLP